MTRFCRALARLAAVTTASNSTPVSVLTFTVRAAQANARKTLSAGFTTVRNLGDGDGEIRALRDAIAAGKLPGPRILTANTSISATAGHGDPRLGYREDLHAAFDAWYADRNEARASGQVTDAAYNPSTGRLEVADYTRI